MEEAGRWRGIREYSIQASCKAILMLQTDASTIQLHNIHLSILLQGLLHALELIPESRLELQVERERFSPCLGLGPA